MVKKNKYIILFCLAAVVVLSVLLFIRPENYFSSIQPQRKVLSQLTYKPILTSSQYQIVKVKIDNKILVEIYKIIDPYNFQLLSQIDTGSKYDGYFLLGGSATNLAYINIDDDPIQEIIVPGFDLNLSAHLNVIKFDSTNEGFQLINQKFQDLPSKNL